MIIVIDNYDSFTYNLVHYLGELGADVHVYRNDHITVDEVCALQPKGILLSPGPATPDQAGICLDLVKAAAQKYLPLFGVCLGLQTIGQAFGGTIERAQTLMHGKISAVTHTNEGCMAGLPTPFKATRYHSLVVKRDTLPPSLRITAETEDGCIMGLRHTSLPIEGVQFHPESIKSEHGHDMLKSFLNEAQAA